ncbi:WD40-repeat-containing domain protein [Pisolithus croceorrhizus]|nr:WD40-repeat-containing domain protein [Pisolithus croceorrhizus]
MTCFCRVGDATLTAVLPLELDLILLGYSNGYIRQASCSSLASRCQKPVSESPPSSAFPATSHQDEKPLFTASSKYSIAASIRSLHFIRSDRTGDAFIVCGSDDGGVAIWSLRDLKLLMRFVHFVEPLSHVTRIQPQHEDAKPFGGYVLCFSSDGTIAVITLDEFQFLCLIPGSASPLTHVYYAGGADHEQIMTIYGDGSARLWDLKAREFRRAMDREKAKESLAKSSWHEFILNNQTSQLSLSLSTSANESGGPVCITSLALQQFVIFTATDTTAFDCVPSYVPKRSLRASSLPQLRALLSLLLTPTLSPEIDEICAGKLGVLTSCGNLDHSCSRLTAACCRSDSTNAWSVSGDASALRAAAIIAALRALSLHEALHDDCETVITFYAASLPTVVGRRYIPPDLLWSARKWFETINDVRQATKVLVDAGVARLSGEESVGLVKAWERHLPSTEGSVGDSKASSLAVFLCGYVSVEKHVFLSNDTLTNISKSVASYLHEEDSTRRLLAVELCSRGFHVWQRHVDAMAILRALFTLAVNSRKDNISVQNVGQQARQAILQIASTNTPLFMTTLTLDILSPKSLEYRKIVMQLVALLTRKKPLLLYSNLPRLMEAVVKSLDPNSTSSRDAVHDTATEIIGYVVKTFPTVDFHMATQRLAVGTCEGAFIMYDLKTATQLYILEGHKKQPTACSFSPDGRRLVTVSLEEGTVLVWKVGSSFTSFFHPGAPPRQGSAGSQPYKTLGFNVGEEANMSIADTLEWVKFEWPSERSVRLHIRESTLTFST